MIGPIFNIVERRIVCPACTPGDPPVGIRFLTLEKRYLVKLVFGSDGAFVSLGGAHQWITALAHKTFDPIMI